LAQLAAKDPKLAVVGAVKEVGIDDEGLFDVYHTYFDRHPVYHDEKWQIYHAMGGKKIGLFRLLKGAFLARSRLNRKSICSRYNFRANPWMIGGILVFDQQGRLVYTMEEQVWEEFPIERLERAIQAARTLNNATNTEKGGDEDTGNDDDESNENDSEEAYTNGEQDELIVGRFMSENET